MTAPLRVDRDAVIPFRLHANNLLRRLPPGSFEKAAFAGLQDSAPRAALLALHARVEQVGPDDWEDPAFVQVWAPRLAVYVVAGKDLPVFMLGTLPRDPDARRKVDLLAAGATTEGRDRHAVRAAGWTIRWDARTVVIFEASRPEGDEEACRLELARRFLHSLGPATPSGLHRWAWVSVPDARTTFERLGSELVEVDLDGEKRWVLASDEETLRRPPATDGVTRLLPLGLDPYLGADSDLLVPDPALRSWYFPPPTGSAARRLYPPPKPWPSGAILVDGELVGAWNRRQGRVTLIPLAPLSAEQETNVVAEAESLPIPGVRRVSADWRRSTR